MWATFEDAILEDTQTFQSTMKQHHKKKKNMVTYCQRKMKEEELEADRKSVALLEDLKSKDKHCFRKLDDEHDKLLALDDAQKGL